MITRCIQALVTRTRSMLPVPDNLEVFCYCFSDFRLIKLCHQTRIPNYGYQTLKEKTSNAFEAAIQRPHQNLSNQLYTDLTSPIYYNCAHFVFMLTKSFFNLCCHVLVPCFFHVMTETIKLFKSHCPLL
jgi:hypothetical protein